MQGTERVDRSFLADEGAQGPGATRRTGTPVTRHRSWCRDGVSAWCGTERESLSSWHQYIGSLECPHYCGVVVQGFEGCRVRVLFSFVGGTGHAEPSTASHTDPTT
jgi:hypothetical protein